LIIDSIFLFFHSRVVVEPARGTARGPGGRREYDRYDRYDRRGSRYEKYVLMSLLVDFLVTDLC
jgi:hypothetical protein